jgi:hypothetical protein
VLDVTLARQQMFYLRLIYIKANRVETRPYERLQEWQAYIAQPDDADACGLLFDFLTELIRDCLGW